MRAASYASFGGPITVGDVPEPSLGTADALIEVRATGICRSDWHGWQGHDPDITAFPHVPGHEFAGGVVAVGPDVTRWAPGDRVVVPFVSGCGGCGHCRSGNAQVCAEQTQPGFTHWGSFAERVVVRHADFNLVRLPDSIGFTEAASLGCRFSTAYRALVDQARVSEGEWLAVYGLGGVGLAAVMIAKAVGSQVVGIDPRPAARRLALDLGADLCLDPDEARERLSGLGGGGPHVTVDAVGSPGVVADAVAGLRRQGRHVQVGLLPGAGAFAGVSGAALVARELTIVGSHGMSAAGLETVVSLVEAGALEPGRLIGREVDMAAGVEVLMRLDAEPSLGVTVITDF